LSSGAGSHARKENVMQAARNNNKRASFMSGRTGTGNGPDIATSSLADAIRARQNNPRHAQKVSFAGSAEGG
jgi:hypothetical protein